jgi:diamine N-acetyltransferase
MVNLRKITEEIFSPIIKMKMPDDQHFVAPNVYSLAEAWLYPCARPFAIFNDDQLVGFLMLDWDEEEKDLGIWRLMITLDQQNKGYGQATLRLVIEMAKKERIFKTLSLDYVPENKIGEHIYTKLGFRPTGEVDEGEIVMTLNL